MIDFLNFMFQTFWHFIGCAMLIGALLNTIRFLWNRFWRHWNIRKHGYPPPHCDADGDFKPPTDKKDE